MSPGPDLVCSARGCRSASQHAVVWRNPALHSPTRRKVWTACSEHVDHLRGYVDLRGFLLEVIPVSQLTPGDG